MAKGNKGDIEILVDSISQTKQYMSPSNLIVYVGTIKEDDKGNKSVILGAPNKLGVFLSSQKAEHEALRKEFDAYKATTRKTIKTLVNIVEILVGQTEANNLNLNEVLDSLEDK